MTYEEAMKILHPNTTLTALAEVEYYGGFNGQEAKIKAVEEACLLACKALEKQIPKKPKVETFSYIYLDDYFGRQYFCPNCNRLLINEDMHGFFSGRKRQYCDVCGQAIDWGESE